MLRLFLFISTFLYLFYYDLLIFYLFIHFIFIYFIIIIFISTSIHFFLFISTVLCLFLELVEFESKVKYLGVFLNCNLKNDDDICRQLPFTYTIANMLPSKFSFCSVAVKNCLFRTFCSNLQCMELTYGL